MDYLQARAYAREMRKNPTPAEELFWKSVRNRKFLDLKFNRQFVVEYRDMNGKNQYYIPDFHCHQYKLIVEIDGKIHLQQKEKDLAREEILQLLGFKIIRFWNEEVLEDMNGVLKKWKDLLMNGRSKVVGFNPT
ncbi:MAG: endonuclease domain-containing protein [Bacteroidota bacterium]